MFHGWLCYAVLSVPCSFVITRWERADIFALWRFAFYYLPITLEFMGDYVPLNMLNISLVVCLRLCYTVLSVPYIFVITRWKSSDLLVFLCIMVSCVFHSL